MPGFDAIYKQKVTLFNRKKEDDLIFWYISVLEGVHLIIDRSMSISTYGEQAGDNARLHVRYTQEGDDAVVSVLGFPKGKIYMPPKAFMKSGDPAENITFAFGDNFDFIMAGVYDTNSPIADADYRSGFFNYMNRTYDDVFAISAASKYNLIPHFEITAR